MDILIALMIGGIGIWIIYKLTIEQFITSIKVKNNEEVIKDKLKNITQYDKIIDLKIRAINQNCNYVAFDNKNKKIIIENKQNYSDININEIYNINYDDIVGVELIENGTSVISFGNIIGGSILAGDAGAIIGGMSRKNLCNNILIKISVNDFNTPYKIITIIKEFNIELKSNQYNIYKNRATEIIETIKYIINNK